MAILGAWTSIADMYEGTPDIVGFTPASNLRPPYVVEGLLLGNSSITSYAKFAFAGVSEFWLSWHFYMVNSTNANTMTPLVLQAPDGTNIFRIMGANAPWNFQLWNGSAWTTVGSSLTRPGGNAVWKFDLRFKMADAGVIELYANGALLGSYSGDTLLTAATQIGFASFFPTYSASGFETLTAIILADESTIDMVFAQNLPSGNGAQTAWAGDYTAIDDSGALSKLDFISSDTNNQVETVTFANLDSAFNSMDIAAVVAATHCRLGVTGPGQIAVVARSGGTDYEAGGLSPEAAKFGPRQVVMNNNPATSNPWAGTSAVNGSELGFKSKAS